MQFKILSHASLCINGGGKSLLVDPWLTGSCYWRSWWNYPPVDPQLINELHPDAIYLTHVHWDHFHGATLKKFSRDTLLLIPYERSPRVRRDLEGMGFSNIVELGHGSSYDLAPDFRIWSYQFASPWGDSALVAEVEGVTLLDANDTKFMGSPLTHVLRQHPHIDFAFRSHSSANDRICLHFTDDKEHEFQEDYNDYIRSFVAFMRRVKPRYAVPFASNHCHLHEDVWHLNERIMTPEQVSAFVEENDALGESELKIMLSGDSWSSAGGFAIAQHDWFENRPAHLEAYRAANAERLQQTYVREGKARVSLRDFQRFFAGFFAAVPAVRKKPLRGKQVAFCAKNAAGEQWFEVDFAAEEVHEIPADAVGEDALVYEAPAAILRTALRLNMFAHAGISKRVSYRMTRANLEHMRNFKQLLSAYEYDVLPLSQLFSMRTVRSYLPRWRELLLYMKIVLRKRAGKTPREIEAELLL